MIATHHPASPSALLVLALIFTSTAFAPFASQAEEAPIMLAPHRAVYDLALGRARDASQVAAVRGRILYDFDGNACEGYTLKFRQVSELDSGEGKVSTSDLRSTTWEGGDAKSFQVHVGEFPRSESRRLRRRQCRAWRRRHRHQARQARAQGARYRRRRGVSDPTHGARDRGGARGQIHSRLSGL